MSETVLITGAIGLVGAPTVARFATDGWQVVATAHRRTPEDVPAGVRIRPTDLSDQTDVECLVPEVAPPR
jgi:NAD(P)-dependent dehydrogenase (short-subunit alcohol dehydrogenase family)